MKELADHYRIPAKIPCRCLNSCPTVPDMIWTRQARRSSVRRVMPYEYCWRYNSFLHYTTEDLSACYYSLKTPTYAKSSQAGKETKKLTRERKRKIRLRTRHSFHFSSIKSQTFASDRGPTHHWQVCKYVCITPLHQTGIVWTHRCRKRTEWLSLAWWRCCSNIAPNLLILFYSILIYSIRWYSILFDGLT